jgi:hypothetical protein
VVRLRELKSHGNNSSRYNESRCQQAVHQEGLGRRARGATPPQQAGWFLLTILISPLLAGLLLLALPRINPSGGKNATANVPMKKSPHCARRYSRF